MSNPIQFSIRRVEDHDRDWVGDFVKELWGDDHIVVHQELFFPHLLPGFLACQNNNHYIGLVTYRISSDICEIVTLNSLIENQGVGTALLEAVISEGIRRRCSRLVLTTTNDNQQAIDFYDKNGFALKEIRQGAVEKAREIKPSIPRFTPEGIAIQDEWEFEMSLAENKGKFKSPNRRSKRGQ